MIPEGSRSQGFKGSSEMLKNYKDLKVWQKSYELCLEIYRITAKFPKEERYGLISMRRNRKNVNRADKISRKQTLESLNPGILGPSSPTKLEKNQRNRY